MLHFSGKTPKFNGKIVGYQCEKIINIIDYKKGKR